MLLDFLFRVLWDSHEGRGREVSPTRQGKPTSLAGSLCMGGPCCQETHNPSTSDFSQHRYFSASSTYRRISLETVSSSVRDRVSHHSIRVSHFKAKCLPMLPSRTRSFHNLLKIWTNLTWPPSLNQSLRVKAHGCKEARRQGAVALSQGPAPETLQVVKCEVWAWGRWLICHTHPQPTCFC